MKTTIPGVPEEELFISKERFYKACHISKRTALRLIQTGVIPAIDTHRKTDRYLIPREAVIAYLTDRKKHPEKYCEQFRAVDQMRAYSQKRANKMIAIAAGDWSDEADILSVQDVSRLTGYLDTTIYRWRIRYDIPTTKKGHKMYISKVDLLAFIASPEFHSIERKSEIHFDLLRRATYGK